MEIQRLGSAPAPSPAAPAAPQAPSDPVDLRILHMNDLHGEVDRAAVAARVMAAERTEATLALNAGDVAEGTMVAFLTKGKVVAETLDRMGFDALELGNHDFAWGQPALQEMLDGIQAPVLGGNIVSGGRPWKAPYVLRDVGGVRVAVLGVDTPDMKRFLGPEKLEGLDFADPAATVARYLPEVRQQGAEVVVVLSHLGFEEDRKLARAVPGIDVIVGGHSHTELPEGHLEGSTVIVQAGAKGRHVGSLDLSFDPSSRRLVGWEARLLPVEGPPDPEIQAIVDRAKASVADVAGRVMGEALEDLPHSHREPAMINQIHADSLLAASGAEIALCSVRNPRSDVPRGAVTYEQLFAAYPMTEEDAVVLRASGRTILAELEERVADGGRGVAVPAGFRYRYDPSLPSGSRVTSVVLADGAPLDPDREYTVATTATTARKKRFAQGETLRNLGSSQEIFMDHFTAGSPWSNRPDGRIGVGP